MKLAELTENRMEAELKERLASEKKDTLTILTENLEDTKIATDAVKKIFELVGTPIKKFPHWHPLLKLPTAEMKSKIPFIFEKNKTRKIYFSNGILVLFSSHPDQKEALDFFTAVKDIRVHEIDCTLYKEQTPKPLLIESTKTKLGIGGTIVNFDAIIMITQHLLNHIKKKKPKQTWTETKAALLGKPMGATSSAFLSAKTMANTKKIFNALIDSGYENDDLVRNEVTDMDKDKLDKIGTKLIKEAIESIMTEKDKTRYEFDFSCNRQDCHAFIETLDDEARELFVKVVVGSMELIAEGIFYSDTNTFRPEKVIGAKRVAKRFL